MTRRTYVAAALGIFFAIDTGAVQDGSVITGTYRFQIEDGSGPIMTDAVTRQPGGNNSIGGIQDFELTNANADPRYVIQHMLAYELDPTQVDNEVVWPLLVSDQSFETSGALPQGLTIGIPADTRRPEGKSRGFDLLFDNLHLSPPGGQRVAPSTFGAWYPSGYAGE